MKETIYEGNFTPLPGEQVYDGLSQEQLDQAGALPSIARGAGQSGQTIGRALRDVPLLDTPGRLLGEGGKGIVERNPRIINSVELAAKYPGTFIKEAVSEQIPQIGAFIAASRLGAGAGKALTRGQPAAARAAAAETGSTVGGVAPIFGQEYGEIRGIQDETGIDDRGRALVAATAATGLERLTGLEPAIARLGKGSRTAAAGTLLGNVAKRGGANILTEGATEYVQTGFEQAGGGQALDTPEAEEERRFGALAGAAGGGVIGGAVGAAESLLQDPEADPNAAPTALPTPPAAPIPKTGADRVPVPPADIAAQEAARVEMDLRAGAVLRSRPDGTPSSMADWATLNDPAPLAAQLDKSIQSPFLLAMNVARNPVNPLEQRELAANQALRFLRKANIQIRDMPTSLPAEVARPWESKDAGPLTKAVGAGVQQGTIADPYEAQNTKTAMGLPMPLAMAKRVQSGLTARGIQADVLPHPNMKGRFMVVPRQVAQTGAQAELTGPAGQKALSQADITSVDSEGQAKRGVPKPPTKTPITAVPQPPTAGDRNETQQVQTSPAVPESPARDDPAGQVGQAQEEQAPGQQPESAAADSDDGRKPVLKDKPAPRATGAQTRITTADGSKTTAQWAVVEADDVQATMGRAENQPRDRTRAASQAQISAIAGQPDYDLVSDSPTLNDGAPALAADGRVVAGNGRFAGIAKAYAQGTAAAYRARLEADAVSKGIDPETLKGVKNPVLVRLLPEGADVAKLAVLSNEGGAMRMSALEQAKVDADRLGDIGELITSDDGNVNLPSNRPYVRRMLSNMPIAQQNAIVDAKGGISQEGALRLRNAVLFKAYGDTETLSRLVESTDPGPRTILTALLRSAPRMAKMREAIAAGELQDADITGDLLRAVELFNNLKAKGDTVQSLIDGGDMVGYRDVTAEALELAKWFEANIRSATKMASMLDAYATELERYGPPGDDMLGGKITPKKSEVLSDAAKRASRETGAILPGAAKPAVEAQPVAKRDEEGGRGVPAAQPKKPEKIEGKAEQQVAAPESGATRAGKVGMQLAAGEIVTTASGRKTTPFPKINTGTKGGATKTVKAADRWLMENALAEADTRGDDFNATQFRANLERPSQSDKDGAEEYLFGEQPEVQKPITRPLAPKPKALERPIDEILAAPLPRAPAPKAIHALAKTKGLNADSDSFKALSKRVTGAEHLDDMAPAQRQQIADHLEGLPDAPTYGSSNTVVTKAAADKALEVLRKKLGQINIGLDPELMQAAMTRSAYHVEAGARKFTDFSKAMLRELGEAIRPYLKMLYNMVRDFPGFAFEGMQAHNEVAGIDINTIKLETPDAATPGLNLERDRPDAETPAVEADGSPGPTGDDGRARPGIEPAEEAEVQQPGGTVLPPRSAAPAGEPSDQPVHREDRTAQSSLFIAGADNDPRGGGFGDDGIPVESNSAGGAKSAAAANVPNSKLEQQRQAGRLEVKPADADNIRATLPILLEGQQEDVGLAEKRFAKPDGYGALFTNGTGTGKTVLGLGVIKRLAMQGKTNILIVAPRDGIIDAWQKFGIKLGLVINRLDDTTKPGTGITITTYANFGANETLADREWDLVVHDEAHYLAQDKDGTNTNALHTLRAITRNPEGALTRAKMLHRGLYNRLTELSKATQPKQLAGQAAEKVAALQRDFKKVDAEWREKYDAVREDVDAKQGAGRTRALFLSATPFAYEKTVDWANGYLFDYAEGRPKLQGRESYNQGDDRDRFFMQHFGYRMRYNKLTEPDAKVDRGLMQRQFNGWLKKRGVLAGRMLDVPADYDRKFILVDSAIGVRIDAALDWVRERSTENEAAAQKAGTPNGYSALRTMLDDKFDYLSRRYLLEAIKATEVLEHVKQHMAIGRKVVVFHDYKKGGGFNPFDIAPGNEEGDEAAAFRTAAQHFRREFSDLVEAPLGSMASPINVFQKEFPGVLLFNGDVPPKQRRANVEKFQDDASGPQVLLVQSAAGKEGISLHDTTGKHQRVLFNLGHPTQPTTAIQQEGRIYRVGQVTDAIFRYLNTGTAWEKWAFATTIAQRASAAENLGMGEQARALKDAFISGFEESGEFRAGDLNEGKGGKERDRASNDAITEYDRARAFYWGTQKKDSRSKAREGKDYFATPEPVGLKMVEWADIRPGEHVLEPSAGHGAIARWIPEDADRVAIEPSGELGSRLAMVFGGKIISDTFENHNVVNKYDVIVMNPPFGSGGKTAIEHLDLAYNRLRDGGRMVALIPAGPAADKRFAEWLDQRAPAVRPKTLGVTPAGEYIYAGDTIKSRASWAPVSRAVSFDTFSNSLIIRVGTEAGTTSVSLESITGIDPTGNRTPEGGRYLRRLVADITLPQSTFERAGTGVATHIVVLDKLAIGQQANPQVQRDYTDAEGINKLFDRLEDAKVPQRTKPKAEAEPARGGRLPATAPAGTSDRMGLPTVEYTTNKGKVIRGIVRTDLSVYQASSIDPYTFKYQGGWFIREKHLKPESGVSEPSPDYGLSTYTEADLKERQKKLADQTAAEKAIEAKAEADRKRGAFTLSGSTSEADQAAAAGQMRLLESKAAYNLTDEGQYPLLPDPEPGAAPAESTSAAVRRGLRPKPLIQRDEVEGKFGTRTQLVTVHNREIGSAKVRTAEEAASALAYLSKGAQERFDVLLTDKSGTPLAIIGSFKGTIDGASVYLNILTMEASRVSGAANAWLSHSHPSGIPESSMADRVMTARIKEIFRGSEITVRDHIIFGGDKYNVLDAAGTPVGSGIPVKPATATRKVPVVEREFVARDRLAGKASDPASAKLAAQSLSEGKSGIMLLDAQHNPIAFVPVAAEQSMPLRNTGGMDRIMRAVSVANSTAGMIVNHGQLGAPQVRNIGGLLKSLEVRVLDVIETDPYGGIISWAQRGWETGSTFESRAEGPTTGVSMSVVDTAFDTITAKLPNAPKHLSYESAMQLPAEVRGDATATTEGFFRDGFLYTFSDAISDKNRATWVIFHELEHAGLLGAHGANLNAALAAAEKNFYIGKLAEAIRADRSAGGQELSRLDSVNEAMAELSAAIRTGNFDALQARYGVTMPLGFRNGIEGAIGRFIEALRKILNDMMGRTDAFTDADVRAMLEGSASVLKDKPSTEISDSAGALASEQDLPEGVRIDRITEDKDGFKYQVSIEEQPVARFRNRADATVAARAFTSLRARDVGVGILANEKSARRNADVIRRLERDLIRAVPRALALRQKLENRGYCFPTAVRFAYDGGHTYLIGAIESDGAGSERIHHAVARLADGRIYDGTLDKLFAPGIYEKSFDFQPAVSMSGDQVGAFTERTGLAFPDPQNLGLVRDAKSGLFSQAPVFGALNTAQQRAMRNVGGIVDQVPFREQVKSLRKSLGKSLGKKLAQGIADQFRSIKDLDQHAYILARLSKATDGATEALMLYGNLRLIDGVYDSDASGVGVIDVMKKLQGEQNRFLWWIAANRAESLKAEDRERLFSDEDISTLKTMNQGKMPDGSSRAMTYANVLTEYNRVSANVLDMAEQSGTIDAESRKMWEKEFYVPFYRAMEDGISGPNIARKSGMVRQYAFKKLKGGKDKLNQDLMANVMMNWAHLISSAAKNRGAEASLVAAERAGAATRIEEEQKGAVFFLKNGQKEWYTVEDPYILEAVSALEYNGLTGPTVELMGKFKRALTIGVTASPAFKIRNLLRDSLSAIATTPLGYNALTNVGEGISIMRNKRGQEYASLLASGGIIRFGTMLEGNRSSNIQRLINSGVDRNTVVSSWDQVKDKIQAALDKYNDIGDISEGANRAALYRKLKAEGKSHAEAAFAARDLLDFSMGGTYGAVRFLTTVVPFMNARIQGLYKLGRSAKEDPRRFAAVTGAVALASIVLMLAYEDDEDWKKREDWDRDQNWWFKIGGVAFRIPKPFEVGAIGTLAERGVELFASDEMTGKRFMKRLGAMVGNTFAMNPVPQMFKPMVDIYANVDSFTGRPIEKMSMERLAKSQRYDGRTSEVARFLGLAGDYTGISPAQADHMIRAYFGWLGTAATTVVDYGIKPALTRPSEPAMQLRDIFLVGAFAEELPSGSSRYVTVFYEQANEIEAAYATWRQKLKEGDVEGAAEYREDNESLIAQRKRFAFVKRRLSGINARVRAIENDYRLSPDTKRAKIDAMRSRSDALAQRISGST